MPLLVVTGPRGAGKSTRIGHGFSDEPATRKMHDSFAAADVDPRHALDHPPGAPDEVADRITVARAAGRFTLDRSPRDRPPGAHL